MIPNSIVIKLTLRLKSWVFPFSCFSFSPMTLVGVSGEVDFEHKLPEDFRDELGLAPAG